MAQLHCYLPDDEAKALRRRAERVGMSVSRYLAELARRDGLAQWPEGYFERVFGGEIEPIKRGEQGEFKRRAELE